jgi:hypothetical protein
MTTVPRVVVNAAYTVESATAAHSAYAATCANDAKRGADAAKAAYATAMDAYAALLTMKDTAKAAVRSTKAAYAAALTLKDAADAFAAKAAHDARVAYDTALAVLAKASDAAVAPSTIYESGQVRGTCFVT